MIKTIVTLLLSVTILVMTSCDQRDTGHITGCMSQNEALHEVQTYYNPYQSGTFSKSLEMVHAIDSSSLSTRDYYEWLELKCNVCESCDVPTHSMDEIQRWVAYADLQGSDRDILAAHLALSNAYYHLERDKYSDGFHYLVKDKNDSIMDLRQQELLFCVLYDIGTIEGDILLLKAQAYALLAGPNGKNRAIDYAQMAEYTEQAAICLKTYMNRHKKSCPKEVKTLYIKHLHDAIQFYRYCGEDRKASEMAFDYLGHAQEMNDPIQLALAKLFIGGNEIIDRNNYLSTLAHLPDSIMANYPGVNLRLYNVKAFFYLFNEAKPLLKDTALINEMNHYKALSFTWIPNWDSAYHYLQLETTPPTTNLGRMENLYITANYKKEHGDFAGAWCDLNKSIHWLAKNHVLVAQHQKRYDTEVKGRIDEVVQQQRRNYEHSLMRVLLIFLITILIICWFASRRYRRMRALNHEIEALNEQLDQLRAEHLQQQIILDDEHETPHPLNEMERIFVRKLEIKRKNFVSTPAHQLIVKYNLAFASSSNPESVSIPMADRHVIMDEVLNSFSLECQQLQEFWPQLTGTESIYCILHLLGVSRETGAACMETSCEAFRRRKSRIKSKVSESIFVVLFGE